MDIFLNYTKDLNNFLGNKDLSNNPHSSNTHGVSVCKPGMIAAVTK